MKKKKNARCVCVQMWVRMRICARVCVGGTVSVVELPSATAYISLEAVLNVGGRGGGSVVLEQRPHRHDHSWGAVPALCARPIGQRSLHWVVPAGAGMCGVHRVHSVGVSDLVNQLNQL